MVYLNIILIAVICVIVTDCTDFFNYVNMWIWNWVFDHKKPYNGFQFKLLSCSLCQTFWTSLAYLLIIHHLNILMIAYILFIAYLTPVILECLCLLKDIMIKLIDIIYKILKIN